MRILAAILLIFIISCGQTTLPQETTGIVGPKGDKGDKGDPGDDGEDGEDASEADAVPMVVTVRFNYYYISVGPPVSYAPQNCQVTRSISAYDLIDLETDFYSCAMESPNPNVIRIDCRGSQVLENPPTFTARPDGLGTYSCVWTPPYALP